MRSDARRLVKIVHYRTLALRNFLTIKVEFKVKQQSLLIMVMFLERLHVSLFNHLREEVYAHVSI